MTAQSEITARSVRFGSCVSLGLLISHIQGISGYEVTQTALIASSLFLAFLLGEAGLEEYRKWTRARRRKRRQ